MEEIVAMVDAALAAHGGRREGSADAFCAEASGPSELGPNRGFLCEATTPEGSWKLDRLVADGGQRVSAALSVRRFASPEAAAEVRARALERYGGGTVFLGDGAISWCYDDVVWTADRLVVLSYGCHISLRHVHGLRAIREGLLALGVTDEGAVGIRGTHSGWTHLQDRGGAGVIVPPERRWSHFVRVVGVEADDVLWVRARPPEGGELGAVLGKLAPGQPCVPVVADLGGSWVRVRAGDVEGWSSRRYLEAQPTEACR